MEILSYLSLAVPAFLVVLVILDLGRIEGPYLIEMKHVMASTFLAFGCWLVGFLAGVVL